MLNFLETSQSNDLSRIIKQCRDLYSRLECNNIYLDWLKKPYFEIGKYEYHYI